MKNLPLLLKTFLSSKDEALSLNHFIAIIEKSEITEADLKNGKLLLMDTLKKDKTLKMSIVLSVVQALNKKETTKKTSLINNLVGYLLQSADIDARSIALSLYLQAPNEEKSLIKNELKVSPEEKSFLKDQLIDSIQNAIEQNKREEEVLLEDLLGSLDETSTPQSTIVSKEQASIQVEPHIHINESFVTYLKNREDITKAEFNDLPKSPLSIQNILNSSIKFPEPSVQPPSIEKEIPTHQQLPLTQEQDRIPVEPTPFQGDAVLAPLETSKDILNEKTDNIRDDALSLLTISSQNVTQIQPDSEETVSPSPTESEKTIQKLLKERRKRKSDHPKRIPPKEDKKETSNSSKETLGMELEFPLNQRTQKRTLSEIETSNKKIAGTPETDKTSENPSEKPVPIAVSQDKQKVPEVIEQTSQKTKKRKSKTTEKANKKIAGTPETDKTSETDKTLENPSEKPVPITLSEDEQDAREALASKKRFLEDTGVSEELCDELDNKIKDIISKLADTKVGNQKVTAKSLDKKLIQMGYLVFKNQNSSEELSSHRRKLSSLFNNFKSNFRLEIIEKQIKHQIKEADQIIDSDLSIALWRLYYTRYHFDIERSGTQEELLGITARKHLCDFIRKALNKIWNKPEVAPISAESLQAPVPVEDNMDVTPLAPEDRADDVIEKEEQIPSQIPTAQRKSSRFQSSLFKGQKEGGYFQQFGKTPSSTHGSTSEQEKSDAKKSRTPGARNSTE